jgi:uncharacterized membrane protein (UPF0182 family)
MESTLEEAIAAVFGQAPSGEAAVTVPPIEQNTLSQARDALAQAQKTLEQGQWQEFGKAMDELEKILNSRK